MIRALAALALFAVGPLPAQSEAGGRPPNIVFVLVDDLGWADLGCYGNAFHETPRIDRLAREGVRFSDFYAAGAVCSPTRASVLAGQYQARFSLTSFIPGHWRPFEKLVEPANAPHLPLEIETVAELLESAGYSTAHFGKWHLGPTATHGPSKQGFAEAIVTSGQHFAPRFRTQPTTEVRDGEYLADFLTDRTLEFIEKNRDRPFFVHLSHYAVHIPLQAEDELIAKYRAKDAPAGGVNHPVYAAMVEHVDRSVGRIVDRLDELGLADDTAVIVTSDNGGLRQRFDGRGDVVTSNAPLRDEKGSLYEGGIRVPLIVRWPGVTARGQVCDEPVISVDFLPTFVEIAGAAGPGEQPVDGRSLVPLLADPDAQLARDAIYWHYPHYHHSRPAGAVRAGRFKLIEFFDTGDVELYDLRADLSEARDLAAEMPGRARELRSMLGRWRVSVGAHMPEPNPEYDPERAGEWWSRRTKKPLARLEVAPFAVDVTPPVGSPLCDALVPAAREIVDPLSARGVVLRGNGAPVVLCAVDWVGIGNGGHDRWRDALAAAAGTTRARVAVHALHPHDAPGCDFEAEELLAEHGLSGAMFPVAFAEEAIARAARAVGEASRRTRRVTHIGVGRAEVDRVASNRRILGDDGKVAHVRYSSCRDASVRAAPEGVVDREVRVISFWDGDTPIATLSYYATHPQSYYGAGGVSPDFVGLARDLREAAMDGVPAIHFNGAGGNVAAGKYNDGSPENRAALTARLADGMARAWDATERRAVTPADLEWRVVPVVLPPSPALDEHELRAILEDRDAEVRDRVRAARDLTFLRRARSGRAIELSCLTLGGARVLHMPGELFVEYQLRAQELRPDLTVCMAAYGDYGPGYIGTEIAYGQGGYETGRVSRVAPEVEAVLMAGLAELLR